MKYFLIAGEASGDMHGSNLMKGIIKTDPSAEFMYYGGDKMQEVGGTLAKHYNELALMGIWEAFKNLKKFKGFLDTCKKEINSFHPDVLILIDYAGFNLRIAKFGKKNQIPVYYYILPKLWAWGKSRAGKIRRFVDNLFVILPFEVNFYKKLNIHSEFYGNPVIDVIDSFLSSYNESKDSFKKRHNLSEKPIVALLAGSRKLEIDLCLPAMIKATQDFPEYQFVLAGAASIQKEYYDRYTKSDEIRMVYDETYPLLKHAYAAVVTSGTATLETGLMNVPEVVIYKTSNASFYIGQFFILLRVIHVKFFCLINIILDRLLVKEFLQFRLSGKIKKELKSVLDDQIYREKILSGYKEVRNLLGNSGASDRVAQHMVESLKTKTTF